MDRSGKVAKVAKVANREKVANFMSNFTKTAFPYQPTKVTNVCSGS